MRTGIGIFILFLVAVSIRGTSIEDLQQKINNSKNDNERMTLLLELAQQQLSDDSDGAITTAQDARNIAVRLNDGRSEYHALVIIADAYRSLNKLGNAIEYFSLAAENALRAGDESAASGCFHKIGNIQLQTSNFEQALENYFRALEIREKIKDLDGRSQTLNNIGIVYHMLKRYDKALDYYNKAAIDFEKTQNLSSLASVTQNIGTIYYDRKELDIAYTFFLRSLEVKEKLGSRHNMPPTLNNLGLVLRDKGELEKSLVYFNKAADLSRELNDQSLTANAMVNIATVHIKQKQFGKAESELAEALKIAVKNDSYDVVGICYDTYSELYYLKGDLKKALDMYKEYTVIQKKIFDNNLTKKLAESEIKYQTAQKDKEILLLKKVQQFQIMMRNILIAGVLLLMIVIIMLYHSYRLKIKTGRIIKEQNEALSKAYGRMEELARTDTLTVLPNRRALLEKIVYEQDRAERNIKPFGIMLADIDHFKKINDTYGHDCGDFILSNIAQVFKGIIRRQDIVGRWGGEEFLFILPETDRIGSLVAAEKIRAALKGQTFNYNGHDMAVTITIGVSIFMPHDDYNDTIKQADEALYEGKRNGRNNVTVFNK